MLSRANYHVTCCYMRLWANHANDDNRCAPLAFPTHKWNVVNSNATSFPAQNSYFRAKWNAPLYIYPSAERLWKHQPVIQSPSASPRRLRLSLTFSLNFRCPGHRLCSAAVREAEEVMFTVELGGMGSAGYTHLNCTPQREGSHSFSLE